MSHTYGPPPAATSGAAPLPRAADRRARLLVLAVWAVLTLAAAGFVVVVGTDLPAPDEWDDVPALTGNAAAGVWVWDGWHGPLPRAVRLALFRVTGDFRAALLAQAAALAALSLGLMSAARRVRGRAHWADVAFPVAVLTVGPAEVLLDGRRLGATLLAVLLTGAVAVLLVRRSPRTGVAAAGLAGLAALCGADAWADLAAAPRLLLGAGLALGSLVLLARGGRAGEWGPVAVCVAAAGAFPYQMTHGMAAGAQTRGRLGSMALDVGSTQPAAVVAADHLGGTPHEAAAARGIPILRAARGGAP